MNGPLPFREHSHRLLAGIFAVSLMLHLFAIYLAGGWRTETRTVLEFSLRDDSPPASRPIPRPRPRNAVPVVRDAPPIADLRHQIPAMDLEARTQLTPLPREMESVPEIPNTPVIAGINASDWSESANAGGMAVSGGNMAREAYFDMVRQKIESRKKYPASARARQIEGRVTVGFAMDAGGRAADVRVVKSSGHESLDQAAVEAVRSASPFPAPPSGMIKNTIPLEVVIAFELT